MERRLFDTDALASSILSTHKFAIIIAKPFHPPMQTYAKGVRRVDDERSKTHGWSAIVSRVSGKATRTFSDNAHGGREAAYQKAVAWAEEHFKKYPAKKRIARITHLRRNNRSGISGVYRYPADESDQRPGAYWAAKWVVKPNTPPKIRKLMIAKYGESQAKWLAIQARIKGVEATADIEFAERSNRGRPRKNRSAET